MKTSLCDPISEHVPERWFWHYQRLQSFREHLLDNRAVQITEVSEPLEPHSMNMADSATDEFDHDLALGILSQEQDAFTKWTLRSAGFWTAVTVSAKKLENLFLPADCASCHGHASHGKWRSVWSGKTTTRLDAPPLTILPP